MLILTLLFKKILHELFRTALLGREGREFYCSKGSQNQFTYSLLSFTDIYLYIESLQPITDIYICVDSSLGHPFY